MTPWGLSFLGSLVGKVRGKFTPAAAPAGPRWEPVRSSNVAAVAFEQDLSGAKRHVLMVRFRNGSEYHYYGVPLPVYVNFLSASSKGRFVWTDLRDRYAYKQVK